jgi:signal transduction histidine kinase
MAPLDSSTDEGRRLLDLYSYSVLDTPAEDEFDDVTKLASYICRTPISLISFVDAHRIWFKSRVGLGTNEIPRLEGFCRSAIHEADLLLVSDTLADRHFAAFAPEFPKLRFYAGAPLITPRGNHIGTLCVIDVVPRELDGEQVASLESLARVVVRQLELGRSAKMQEETHFALRDLQSKTEEEVRLRTKQLASSSVSLQKLTTQLMRAQDEERRRIARELHDSTGQVLAALGMNIGLMEKQSSEVNLPKFEECRELIGLATSEIRNLSYLLHPPLMDEAGLVSAVREYASGFAARSGLSIQVEIEETIGRLDSDREMALFRVIQESLGNVYRHSGSATATINLYRLGADIVLEISDQGQGLPAEMGGAPKFGVGITSMQERLRQIGGTFQIETGEAGTKVTALLPNNTFRDFDVAQMSSLLDSAQPISQRLTA